MSPTGQHGGGDMSLTVLIIVTNEDRSREYYHHVIGAEIVRDRDPAILRLGNGVIVLNVGGGPTGDKPTVTMAPPANPDTVSMALNMRVADIHAVYHAWRARGPHEVVHVPHVSRSSPPLGDGHADAAGECGQAGQGCAVAGAEEVFGYPVDRWPVADFGWCGVFGG